MEYFSNLMQNDFMEFANNESSLAAEAEAVITMQSVEKELEMITGFPDIFGKCIIALAGGFSCGKSSFINSFFSNDMIKLPVGINPVTAIPTYVIAGKKPRIRGYSNCGGSFEILPEMFQQLSYDIENEFQYSIRKIVPYLALSAELNGLIISVSLIPWLQFARRGEENVVLYSEASPDRYCGLFLLIVEEH